MGVCLKTPSLGVRRIPALKVAHCHMLIAALCGMEETSLIKKPYIRRLFFVCH